MIQWISIDRVLAIHSRQISEHGGSDGLRDRGLLESALFRPQNIETYEPDSDIATLAAAYAFGIVKNPPFIDGNKRTGYVVMETFLIKKGFELNATPAEKYLTIISLAEGTLSEEELVDWQRERIIKV
jgi:death-on-curing protein